MRPALKLSPIDREHLQELYDAAGVARDELPYSEKFDEIWQGFQDRTFKNAEREQLYGALIKYVRSSTNAGTQMPTTRLSEDQLKQLKSLLARHAPGGKILPYSDEFNNLRGEFARLSGVELSELELWQGIVRSHGAKRPPPRRKPVAAPQEAEDEGE